MSGPVDVRKNLRMALQHVLICGPDETVQRAIQDADDAVAELIEAAKEASATLGHAYHTTLIGQLAEYAHTDYQRLDAAIARVQGGAE